MERNRVNEHGQSIALVAIGNLKYEVSKLIGERTLLFDENTVLKRDVKVLRHALDESRELAAAYEDAESAANDDGDRDSDAYAEIEMPLGTFSPVEGASFFGTDTMVAKLWLTSEQWLDLGRPTKVKIRVRKVDD